MDAAARSLRSRLGGYRTAALYDSRAINEKARRTYRESFRAGHECRLCPLFTMPVGLSEAEIDRRSDALRREHYLRLSIASATARSTKKARRAIGTPRQAREAGDRDAEPQAEA